MPNSERRKLDRGGSSEETAVTRPQFQFNKHTARRRKVMGVSLFVATCRSPARLSGADRWALSSARAYKRKCVLLV
jgi:hypothetical protein